MMLIEARGIVVERDGRRSLDEVDFDLRAGELVGVVGPNGSGKTTLLRALLGLQETRAGEVKFEGRPTLELPRRTLAQAIGYLPQGAAFHWPLTVDRAVGLGRFPYQAPLFGMSNRDAAAIQRAMETAGIRELATRRVDRISGGERMRVHLARLLAGEHRGIVADEPTSSLDAKYQLHFLSVLKQQAAKGTGVMVTLHDLSLAARYCDRLVVLKDGRVVVADVPEVALDDATLAAVFEIRAERLQTSDGISIVPTQVLSHSPAIQEEDRGV
jgi:iron complex transport system ATP-binding protein